MQYRTLVGFEVNFDPVKDSTSQGLPYDFSSIMHFRHNAFSYHRHKSTVVSQTRTIPKAKIGNSDTGTEFDYLHINILYCGGKLHARE